MTRLQKFLRKSLGASAVEYALLLGVVAAVGLTAISDVGTQVQAIFWGSGNSLNAIPTPITITSPPVIQGTAGQNISFVPVALGGVGTKTWSMNAGTLPLGVSGVDASTGSLSGAPAVTGTFNFQLGVADTVGDAASQAFALVVNPALAISSTNCQINISGTELTPDCFHLTWNPTGNRLSVTLSASGGTAPYTWSISGTRPIWLNPMSIASPGSLVTRSVPAPGSYDIPVMVTDAVGNNATQTITLIATTPVAITSSASTSGDSGFAFAFTPAATGGFGAYTWSLVSGTPPTGLTLDPTSGKISGTTSTAGTSTLGLTVTDSLGSTTTQSFTLTINPAVTINSANTASGDVNVAFSYSGTATGGSGTETWSIASGTLPAGLTLNVASGVISGTPSASGTSTVSLQVTDAIGNTNAKSVAFTINPTVVITAGTPPAGDVNIGYSFAETASGGNGAYTWSVSGGSLPGGVSLNTANGTISGTPSTSGTFTPTIKLVDSMGSSTTKTLIIPINAAVAITSGAPASGEVSVGFSFSPSASGGTGSYTWSIASGSLPSGLSINASSGVISGTPSASGSFTFGLTATDTLGGATSQTLTLTVNAAVSITLTTIPVGAVGTAMSFTPTISGGSAPYTWTLASGTLPTGLSFDPNTGTISGTPSTGTGGASTITLNVTDAFGSTTSHSYSLTVYMPLTWDISVVTATNPGPTITETYKVGQWNFGFVSGWQAPAAVEYNGLPLTYSVISGLPPNLVFIPSTRVLQDPTPQGTPIPIGVYNIVLQASDGFSQTQVTYTLTIKS